jgi:uncharacterized protein YkvS
MRELTFTGVVVAGLLGMIGNSLFDLFRQLDKSDAWRPLTVGVIGIIVLAIVLSPRFRKSIVDLRKLVIVVPEPKTGVRRKALVAFVSVGNGRTSALQAAQYHLGVLEHLWLITSKDGRSDADWVVQQIEAALAADTAVPRLKIHATTFLDEILSIPEAKAKVELIRHLAIKVEKIPENEVICDFTGLNKLASAGMILACAPRSALLQYMYPNQAEEGRPVYAAGSTPREIAIAYRVAEDPDA